MATERLITGSLPVFTYFHILVFGSSLLVYNTPRIAKMLYGRLHDRHRLAAAYIMLFLLGIVLTAVGLYRQAPIVLFTSAGLGMLAFGYFLPLLPFKRKKRLRDYGGIKILVLAGVWTTATSVLPLLYWQKALADYPLEIALRFTFIFTLCVVFDIRDIRADQENNIATLPGRMGLENSYILVNITLLLFGLLSVSQYFRHPDMARLAGALLTALITRLVVTYLRRNPSDRAYVFLADGVMLLYALLVLLPVRLN